MGVPRQPTRKSHRHVWAEVERVVGFDVLKCCCGEKKFRRVKGRQLELFEL